MRQRDRAQASLAEAAAEAERAAMMHAEECKRLNTPDVTCPLAEVFVTWLTPTELAEMRGESNRQRRLDVSGNATAGAVRRSLEAPQTELLPSAQEMSSGGETAALALRRNAT